MTASTPLPLSNAMRGTTIFLTLVGLLWGTAVAILAQRGVFLAIPMPAIAILVALGIIVPTAAYFLSVRLRAWIEAIGLHPITVVHVWRVPAAFAFFAYGLTGQLPTLFWVLAGTGDLIAGLYAAKLAFARPDNATYLRFHLFGFADFVVAVGTGLAFTLLQDPRMATIAVLPMALIPLFGVGISGASHLIAFDQLRRASGSSPQHHAVARRGRPPHQARMPRRPTAVDRPRSSAGAAPCP
jgi:hypothetical protein